MTKEPGITRALKLNAAVLPLLLDTSQCQAMHEVPLQEWIDNNDRNTDNDGHSCPDRPGRDRICGS